MPATLLTAFEPRKTPVQARAEVTVEAICEATIQVLLSHGAERLTTTRVADRAGVSVGTLYQYYPNKRSLLYAAMEEHLDRVATAVESASKQARNKPLAQMIKQVVEVFVDAKMDRADISVALYKIATDIGGPELVKRANQRMRKAVEALLHTAPDSESAPDPFAVDTMLAAMSGTMRSLLEARPSAATVRKLREQLVLLCQSYMWAATTQR
jgi:AcrR family transcriptional regulator